MFILSDAYLLCLWRGVVKSELRSGEKFTVRSGYITIKNKRECYGFFFVGLLIMSKARFYDMRADSVHFK